MAAHLDPDLTLYSTDWTILMKRHSSTTTTTTGPPNKEDSAFSYASIIAGAVTWLVIIAAILILVRKIFLCLTKASLERSACGQRCLGNKWLVCICRFGCCTSMTEEPEERDSNVEVTRQDSSDPYTQLPPCYDVALNMPKPEHSDDTDSDPNPHHKALPSHSAYSIPHEHLQQGVDNEGFTPDQTGSDVVLHMGSEDPELPSYDDFLRTHLDGAIATTS